MFNKITTEAFWVGRINRLLPKGDPCHYQEYWQDRYTFKVRTKALSKLLDVLKPDLTEGSCEKLVDIGCGTGTYTKWLALNTLCYITGYDRKEFVEHIAPRLQERYRSDTIPFKRKTIKEISNANIITLLTVYDFLPVEYRTKLLSCLSLMQSGSYIVLLDINRDEVESYQKNLSHKLIETRDKKCYNFYSAGFDLECEIPVNYIDSKIFHRVKSKKLAYYLSLFADKVMSLFCKPVYTILVFRKL